jgi:hypothetical protein
MIDTDILAGLVKPLVWTRKSDWHYVADNPFGECWVKHYITMNGLWTLYGPGHYGPGNNYPTLEAAQAAANADHAARVITVLDTDKLMALVAAAKRAAHATTDSIAGRFYTAEAIALQAALAALKGGDT